MDDERILESERLQIEQIRELDMEELQIEEVDTDLHQSSSSSDESTGHGDGGAGPYGGFTFNTCLATLHTYLGEVDETRHRLSFLDGDAILNLPMFYLEGVVLFPGATLPLRVIQSRFKAAVERALNQVDAPYTIGVVHVHRSFEDERLCFSNIGTTAEIRRYRRSEDGSLNVVACGQQRFHLRRRWIDVEGAPCAEVQIIQEDTPLRTPRDAFGQLASVPNFQNHHCSHTAPSNSSGAKRHRYNKDEENDLDSLSDTSAESENSIIDERIRHSPADSFNVYGRVDASTSSDDEFVSACDDRLGSSHPDNSSGSWQQHSIGERMCKSGSIGLGNLEGSVPGFRHRVKGEGWKRALVADESKWSYRGQRSFWPRWVYQMYDSYTLARRAADMWRKIIGVPVMDALVKKPDLLSFYIGSKLPVSESKRQELLEIDGISYRLRREIQLLECFDLVRCKICLTVIAKRSDMVVMSSDGPLNAYVNPEGYVHETMTLYNANGLALIGSPVKEYSWFPGYAWTCAVCAACDSNMGWLFTATDKKLQPRSFWGIRSSQVADLIPPST